MQSIPITCESMNMTYAGVICVQGNALLAIAFKIGRCSTNCYGTRLYLFYKVA